MRARGQHNTGRRDTGLLKGSGRGSVRLEGRMIDVVHYKQAKAILDAAGHGET